MKRLIPIMIVAAVALPSCNDEPGGSVQPAGAITFGAPVMEVETRSTFKDALDAGDSFGVLGYCLGYTVGTTEINYSSGSGLWATKRAYCPPSVFYNQRVTVQQDGTCTYDRNNSAAASGNNPKFWYADGTDLDGNGNTNITGADNYRYTFFAYYPYDGAFTVDAPDNASAAGAPKLTFTMPQTGGNIATVLDHTITPDAMLAALYNRRNSEGNLQFSFRHVLTGLGFVVNNYSSRNLLIDRIELRGTFYKTLIIDATSGTVSYESPANSTYTGTYVVYDHTQGTPEEQQRGGMLLVNDDPDNATVVSSPSPIGGGHIMLISGTQSQSLGPDNQNLQVYIRYKFWDKDVAEPADWKEATPTRSATFTFRSGTRYVAELDFVGDAFTINFVQANNDMWQDGEADDGDETNDDIVFE